MQETQADRYRELDDAALLRLSLERGELTQEAAQALDAELSVRRLTRFDAEAVAEGDRRFDQRIAREQAKKTGSGGLTGRNTALFGNWNVQKRNGAESFTATKFVILGFFPLIPLGTYRLLRRSHRRWWEWIVGRDLRLIEKLPLDWNQVLWMWCKYGFVLLMLLLGVRVYLATHRGI